MAGQGQSVSDFLCQLSIPIVVVDQHWQPVLNNRAISRQNIDPEHELVCILTSEVFGCSCEEDLNDNHLACCLSGTLQRTTAETYRSGIPQERVPASTDLDSLAGISNIRYFITTTKQNNTVLLKIEERKEID